MCFPSARHFGNDILHYRYLVRHREALISQVACRLLNHGYQFFSTAQIPARKDPLLVDARLITKYETAISKATNFRRAAKGISKVQYLRCGQTVVLMATRGAHRFFEDEDWRDAKNHPMHLFGYSLSLSPVEAKVRVRVHREAYNRIARDFEALAGKRSVEWWEDKFAAFPFNTGYAGVRSQVFTLIRAVNLLRKRVRLEPLNWEMCRIRKKLKSETVFLDSPPEVLQLLGT